MKIIIYCAVRVVCVWYKKNVASLGYSAILWSGGNWVRQGV